MVTLANVIFLLGYNARAQCYLQAMRTVGFQPGLVVTFGDPARDQKRVAGSPGLNGGEYVFTPDLTETVSETLRSTDWPWKAVKPENVNDPEIQDIIESENPDIVVYAGYGGQIVGHELLSVVPSFLHMHSGLLPDYRGSTTVYYSWLRENACGVSAILMNAGIDEGPVLIQRRFPAPPADTDVDLLYDNTMRAHVLIDCMKSVASTGELPSPQPQTSAGETFYVIHPVLKHIALLQPRRAD